MAHICNLSIIPLRAEASHRSEMVSQILFGEFVTILEEMTEWQRVRVFDPVYEGWVQKGQLGMSEQTEDKFAIVDLPGSEIIAENGVGINLLPGSVVPSSGEIIIDDQKYVMNVRPRAPILDDFLVELPKLTAFYLHSPYLWGGRSWYGIDCSGLVQVIYRHFGISIPRDAYQQAELGIVVDFTQNIIAGDLAFFDNEEGRINHVGIMINESEILHASVFVRIDVLDSNGIYQRDKNKYSHRLRIVKRLIDVSK